jgi:hypothetical protein
MECFGDVSGHFKSLIKHNCEVVVVGVVIGDKVAAARCPNKTVRDVTDIKEAKWNDLTDLQKRRMIDCLADNPHLEFGYSLFTAEQLHTLKNHYLLHQDVCFPPDWDLALTGYAYGEIAMDRGVGDEPRLLYHIDRVASASQTEAVLNHIQQFVEMDQGVIADSARVKGIQAADCFAGAVAEDFKRDTNWLAEFNDSQITEASKTSLIQLENDLVEYDNTAARR